MLQITWELPLAEKNVITPGLRPSSLHYPLFLECRIWWSCNILLDTSAVTVISVCHVLYTSTVIYARDCVLVMSLDTCWIIINKYQLDNHNIVFACCGSIVILTADPCISFLYNTSSGLPNFILVVIILVIEFCRGGSENTAYLLVLFYLMHQLNWSEVFIKYFTIYWKGLYTSHPLPIQ